MNPHAECVVCGASDARLLSMTKLADGTRAVVCGSHELAHRRGQCQARSVEELRRLTGDRRRARRRGEPADELGDALARAFAKERRGPADRRA